MKFTGIGLLFYCVIFSAFLSCENNPVSGNQDLTKQQYNFAASALYNYFIFRDRIPPDLFAFDTPQDLYKSVNDPYTVFYSKKDASYVLNYWMTTKSGGVGIRLDSVRTGYVIKDVFKGSPAIAAGLLKGDTITQIDGISIAGSDWDSMSTLIRGDIGEKVTFTIKRGSLVMSLDAVRGEFKSPSVFTDSLAPDVSYIYLTEFLAQTNTDGGSSQEFRDALQATSWADYTIFDLRSNGGGEIDQCIDIISEFVPAGTSVMEFTERVYDDQTASMKTDVTVYKTDHQGQALNRKFALLSDTNTASASEILISCLRSNREDIKVIGEHTYGKACGQVLLMGPDTVLAKVTFATLKPLAGASYDHIGITPDIVVNSNNAADSALNLITGNALSKKRNSDLRIGRILTDIRRPWRPLSVIKGK